jgi:hypothetical protein
MRAVALLLLLGCNNQPAHDTAGIPTRDLSLQILVEATEMTTRVSIGIYARDHGYSRLDLQSGERLLAIVEGSAPIAFTRTPGSLATYEALLAVNSGRFTIDLERDGDSARGSVMELPPPFALEAPSSGFELTKPFTLRWSPASNDTMKLSIVAPCLIVTERTLTRDAGVFTWSAADFGKGREPLPCTATIHTRRMGGSLRLAPGLGPVQLFRAEQLRAIGVWATP